MTLEQQVMAVVSDFAAVEAGDASWPVVLDTRMAVFDELAMVQIVLALEQVFDLEISDEELGEPQTVRELVALVERKLASR